MHERLRRAGRWRLALAVLAFCLLLASAMIGAGRALVEERPLAAPDVIVSLASHEWERLPEAARLARAHPRSRVALSVPQSINQWNCFHCADRVAWLGRMGVPRDRIDLMPHHVYRTYDEAVAAREYAAARHARSVLVVTSPYHTRRTLATFGTVFAGSGIDVGVRAAVTTSPARPGWWWTRQYDREYVLYEWAAVVFYWWKYGISPRGAA